MAAEGNSDVIV